MKPTAPAHYLNRDEHEDVNLPANQKPSHFLSSFLTKHDLDNVSLDHLEKCLHFCTVQYNRVLRKPKARRNRVMGSLLNFKTLVLWSKITCNTVSKRYQGSLSNATRLNIMLMATLSILVLVPFQRIIYNHID